MTARVAMLVLNPCNPDTRVIKAAEALAAAGYTVKVFCTAAPDGSAPAFEERNGVAYARLPWRRRYPLPLPPVLSETFLPRNLAIFLHRHFRWRLMPEAFGPAVRGFHPDVIHAHDLVTLPFASTAAKELGAKLVYDAHELELHRNPPLSLFGRTVVTHLEKTYAPRADLIITVGEMIATEINKSLGRSDVRVIYNAPPLGSSSSSDVRSDCKLAAGQDLLVHVGKVTMNRGIEPTLAALRDLPKLHFAVVGPCDAKERRQILALAAELGVQDRFHLLPPVPHTEVVSYIASADLGIVPTLPLTKSYEYSMPNKLFEMSLARLPVIATDLPEAGKFLRHFGNGYLYDPANPKLAKDIAVALAKRNEMRLTDDRFAELTANYSAAAQAKRLVQYYAEMMGAPSRQAATSSIASTL